LVEMQLCSIYPREWPRHWVQAGGHEQ
jgi:hypothetical protein